MNAPQPTSVSAALNLIKDGARIVTGMAAAEPQLFFSQFDQHAFTRKNLALYCANPTKEYPCFTRADLIGRLDVRVMFLTRHIRRDQGRGIVHYVPQHLSQWVPHIFEGGDVDVYWGSCSTPDEHGFVSLGVSNCYESEIIKRAKVVILEMNPKMPFTYGSTLVPVGDVTGFISTSGDIPTISRDDPSTEEIAIGDLLADRINDGATLQLGIGGIPNALGKALLGKRDLGIHTEMINDVMMDLYESGVVTGKRKSIWPGKIIGSFAYGSEKLYRFIDKNPAVELHPASIVNDIAHITRNKSMVSINTAVEIDISGQVCSESVGHTQISGVGGASETHIGAQRSEGGQAFVAVTATAAKGTRSKIVLELQPGAKVSISRNDIDHVVTEYGIAKLRGKSVSERARALIGIAHPQFREELTAAAKKLAYI